MPSGDGSSDSDAGDWDPAADAADAGDVGATHAEPADPAEARLADALERVAHGAVVSVPSILLQQALTVAFAATLTNAFAAGPYGLFVLARRIARFLRGVAGGFGSGLSRFLPNAADDAERDAVATVAVVLLVGVTAVLGAALALAAPAIAGFTGRGSRFVLYLRVFGAGLPLTTSLFAVAGIMRAAEEVAALNVLQRVAFPLVQLAVGAAGALVFADLFPVAVGVTVGVGVVAGAGAVWLARARGFRPRFRGAGTAAVARRYVRFSLPLFLGAIATTTQRLGFYPLIAVFLSDAAGGVFAVGVLVGGLVRLPLIGVNQFIPPVAAALHEAGHRESLSRLYHVTSRLVLVGVAALSVPAVVYREALMALFGPTFVRYAPLLPGFVLAQFLACAAGSVGILLTMTDHQRALLVVNTAITLFLAVTAVPLVVEFGLPGLVASYLLMLGVNNGLEVAVLYRVEGLQPFTRAHLRPLAAAVPFAAIALAARAALPRFPGAVVGTAVGLAGYVVVLRALGFSPAERRLLGTLVERYRLALAAVRERVADAV
ncbi:lipopolysaccharide biosynthesis protein [Halobaculum sp. EA56]|uniref:lipopolysaccharide biosynthesis protein n=1 Tax=Halobaculum sp. EA56 TaxID=3421648 RepID=UPI003EC14739